MRTPCPRHARSPCARDTCGCVCGHSPHTCANSSCVFSLREKARGISCYPLSKYPNVRRTLSGIDSAMLLSQKPYIMSTDINLKDCRKAVNQAKYMPTAERKANALKLLKQLTEAVTNLVEVKPKAKKKPKAKAKPLSKKAIAEAKVKPSKKVSKKALAKLTKAELLAMLSA